MSSSGSLCGSNTFSSLSSSCCLISRSHSERKAQICFYDSCHVQYIYECSLQMRAERSFSVSLHDCFYSNWSPSGEESCYFLRKFYIVVNFALLYVSIHISHFDLILTSLHSTKHHLALISLSCTPNKIVK